MRKTHMYDMQPEKLRKSLQDGEWTMYARDAGALCGVLCFEHDDGDTIYEYPFEYTIWSDELNTELNDWDFSDQQNNYPLFTDLIPHWGWDVIRAEISRMAFDHNYSDEIESCICGKGRGDAYLPVEVQRFARTLLNGRIQH